MQAVDACINALRAPFSTREVITFLYNWASKKEVPQTERDLFTAEAKELFDTEITWRELSSKVRRAVVTKKQQNDLRNLGREERRRSYPLVFAQAAAFESFGSELANRDKYAKYRKMKKTNKLNQKTPGKRSSSTTV